MTVGRFKFEILSKYPHMKPNDVAVWSRFLIQHPTSFESVDYDVHVGDGADFLPTGESTPDERQNRVYQRKIDVVGYKGNEISIIEVKPIADVSALGQILTYKKLSEKSNKFETTPIPIVVCGQCSKEMEEIFRDHDVTVFVV